MILLKNARLPGANELIYTASRCFTHHAHGKTEPFKSIPNYPLSIIRMFLQCYESPN